VNGIDLILAAAKQTSTNSAWVTPTVVLAVLALAVSIGTYFLTGRRTRLDRQRQVFADAFAAVAEYREYPFIVRRRNVDDPAGERQRISSDLSEVQAKLNAFRARLRVEDPYVGERYSELVTATRRVAGARIREAWNNDPVADDSEIHNPSWDFSELDSRDDAYLRAVSDHLGWCWAPVRRKFRRNASKRQVNPVLVSGTSAADQSD
jgi:hypothetical protein